MVPVRILTASAAVGGLAFAAGLAGIPAAEAAALSGTTLVMNAGPFAGGDCNTITTPPPVSATVNAGDTISRSISLSGTSSSAADSSDTVTMHGTQRVTMTSSASGGQLTAMNVSASTSGSVTASRGAASNCTTSSDGTGWNLISHVQGNLHRSAAGWLHVGVHTAGVGAQAATVQIAAATGGVLFQSQLGASALRNIDDDQWVYAPAGDYTLQLGTIAAAATYPSVPTASIVANLTLTFYPAGIATVAESGTAKPMVTFPGLLTCATGRASVRLTPKVQGASKARLYVNGVQQASISNPRARTLAIGVPTDRAVTLRAVVKKAGKTLSATRAYRSC